MPLSTSVKLLGVTFDHTMTFDSHIAEVCRSAQYHLRALRHIRASLDIPSARLLATALIGSNLDYCNSLLTGVSKHNIQRLQRVQNSASRVVLGVSGSCSSRDRLKTSPWLPVSSRIDYNVCLLSFKALTLGKPDYLTFLCQFIPLLVSLGLGLVVFD